MELVKNSYDADADWVKITISTDGTAPNDLVHAGSKGYITLEDNGDGMTYNDIIKKWLVISLSDKREMKEQNKTTKKGRVPLGDKGVGRLSTQRLGQQLEMISGVLDSVELNHLAFNWNDFTSRIPLTKVPVKHFVTPKKPKKKGTKLAVTRLANPDVWKKEGADRFRGQLSQLIFPYQKKRPFAVYLSINGDDKGLDEITEDLQSQAIGHYEFNFTGDKLIIDGKIRLGKLRGNDPKDEFDKYLLLDNGQDFLSFLTNETDNKKYFLPGISTENGWYFSFHRDFEFNKDFPGKKEIISLTDNTDKAVIANPGPFSGEIDDYDLRGTDSTDEIFDGLKQFKNLVTNQIGIRIFRDGFGIKPYGFDGQDWLNLGSGQTSGASFYGLRPNNVVGFVAISMAKNAQLKELTSREGFTESPYSRNFMLLMQRVVREINTVLERTRRSYTDYKRHLAEKVTGFQSIAQPVALLKQTSRQAEAVTTRSHQAQRRFTDLSKTLNVQVDRIQNEPLFAGPGEAVTLPLLKEAQEMVTEGARLFGEINKILNEAKKWEETAAYVSTKVTNLEGQIVQFTELAGLGLTAEALTHDVYVLLERINTHTDEFKQALNRAAVPTAVYEFIEYVRSFSRDLHRQLNHLSPSLKFNREKKETTTASKIVTRIQSYYQNRFEKSGIEFNIIAHSDFIVSANPGKLTQIFDNLILNSEYWLRERKRTESDFSPEIRIEINEPTIKISDNGFGISKNIESTLFQPFITTKPSEIGRGLGLFIVQQLLESMGCDILLLQKRNKFNRRYIFQLNMESVIKS